MSKEGEGLLDQIIKSLQNQQQTEVSATQSAFDQQRLKNEQVDKEYRQLLLPIEQKIFSERTPSEFLKIIADFKSKMEQKIRKDVYGANKMTFKEIGIFKWGDLSTRVYNLDIEMGYGVLGKDRIYPDEAVENRNKVLEELKVGSLDTNTTNYRVIYYYTPDDGRRYPPTYYFGYQSSTNKILTLNVSNRISMVYSGKNDLINLAETLGGIVFKGNLETLTFNHPESKESPEDRSGRI